MKKIILLIIVALMAGITAKSQTPHEADSIHNALYGDYFVKNSTLIFEGKQVGHQNYQDPKTGQTHRVINIQILRILRNGTSEKLKLGTVQIYESSTNVSIHSKDTIYPDIDHYTPIADSGMYFCTIIKGRISYYLPTDNNIVLQVDDQVDYGPQIYSDPYNKGNPTKRGLLAFHKYYRSREEFYAWLKKYENITIPDSLLEKKSPDANKIKSKNSRGSQ